MIANYNQLTIKQFLQCKTIADLEDDPIQRKVKMLAEISGRSIDDVESLPLDQLLSELREFNEIDSLVTNQKVNMKFKVGGRSFVCVWLVQDLTAAQFFDVSHFCKDPNTIVSNIHNILAAICVPRTFWGSRRKYDGAKHKEIATLFYNNMKISQAYPIMLFFCKFYNQLTTNIQTCLEQEVKKLEESLKHLKPGGDGLQSLTTWAIMIGLSGITSLIWMCMSF